MTKLAISADDGKKEEEIYDLITRVRCWGCNAEEGRLLELDGIEDNEKVCISYFFVVVAH